MKIVGFSVGLVFLMAALAVPLVVEAATCSPLSLISCAGAISDPKSQPSKTCCDRLKKQQPCFCQYLKDPTLEQYFTPEVAQRLATACKVTIPTNCP